MLHLVLIIILMLSFLSLARLLLMISADVSEYEQALRSLAWGGEKFKSLSLKDKYYLITTIVGVGVFAYPFAYALADGFGFKSEIYLGVIMGVGAVLNAIRVLLQSHVSLYDFKKKYAVVVDTLKKQEDDIVSMQEKLRKVSRPK